MRKKNLILFLIGIFLVFGGFLRIMAKGKEKKVIWGEFHYFFNDGTMNKEFYGKITEDYIRDDNKTNKNHAVALYLWAYLRLNKLKEQGVEILEETKEELLRKFSRPCIEPDCVLQHISTSGMHFFSLNEDCYKILNKMFHIEDVEITKEMFNIVQKDLINRISKTIDEKKIKNKKIVVAPELFIKQDSGDFLPREDIKKLCEEKGFENNLVVNSEKFAEEIRDEKSIYVLSKYLEEIKKANFDEVKNAFKAFLCMGYLLNTFVVDKSVDDKS